MELYEDKKGANEQEDETKRVEISVVEFDWVFHGEEAKNFIKKLANTDNDNLFAIYTVKIIILFLW